MSAKPVLPTSYRAFCRVLRRNIELARLSLASLALMRFAGWPGTVSLWHYIKNTAESRVRVSSSASKRDVRQKNSLWVARSHPSITLLQSTRARRLQSIIVSKVFSGEFGIDPSHHDLDVLSQYDNAVWLRDSMFRASGIKNKKLSHSSRKIRIKTVYSTFIAILGLHAQFLTNEKDIVSITSIPSRRFRMRLFFRKKQERLVWDCIFPPQVEATMLDYERASSAQSLKSDYRRIESEGSIAGFQLYLEAERLLCESSGCSKKTIEKVLKRLNRIYEV